MIEDDIRYLTAARALLAKGWCQGTLNHWDPNSCDIVAHCSIGAIVAAYGEYLIPGRLIDAVQAAIGTRHVARWNDAPERTQQEVLAAFDRAISILEIDQECQKLPTLKEEEHEPELTTV
jgi:hypothetical protein